MHLLNARKYQRRDFGLTENSAKTTIDAWIRYTCSSVWCMVY